MKKSKEEKVFKTVQVYLEDPVDFMEMYGTWVYGSFKRISEDRVAPDKLYDFEAGNNFWQKLFKHIHATEV